MRSVCAEGDLRKIEYEYGWKNFGNQGVAILGHASFRKSLSQRAWKNDFRKNLFGQKTVQWR